VRLLSFYLRGPGTLLAAFAIGVVLVGGVMWRSMRSHGGNSLGGGSQHRGFGARLHH